MADNKPYGDVEYADPGYQSDGKKRYPIDTADHAKAAWSYINQGDNASQYSPADLAKVKSRIMAACKKFGIETSESNSSDGWIKSGVRSVAFDAEPSNDGRTLEGYAAVYNSPTRIDSWEGTFDEVIEPGAFDSALGRSTPVLMFEHGKHPLIGSMPLGVITDTSSDSRGLHIRARLSDNWLIQPVRDAIRDGGVKGMSFRFDVGDGDKWARRSGEVDLRTIHDFAAVPELGPVVFPAYEPTTATVRSLVERLPDFSGRSDVVSGGADSGTTPGTAEVPSSAAALANRHLHRVSQWEQVLRKVK